MGKRTSCIQQKEELLEIHIANYDMETASKVLSDKNKRTIAL